MHKNFAEWYRLVRIEPKSDDLKNRWAGVEEWTASFRKTDEVILETVRIFQGMPEITSREPFLAAFRKHDPAFPQRNEMELRVLAGASLVKCIESDGEAALRPAVIAGMALEASRLRVSDPQLDEIVSVVVDGLQKVARSKRKRLPFNTTLISSTDEKVALDAIKQIPAAGDWTAFRALVTPVLQAVLDGVLEAETSLADAAHNLRCADEETNVLWWLEGGCSRDLNTQWSILEDEVPIVAGCELADLTDVLLGPRDVTAFLERVVLTGKGKNKDLPLYAFIDAVADFWARGRTAGLLESALDLTPLSLALLQRSRSGAKNWHHFFENTGGIAATKQLAPKIVAKQAYLEAVLLRTLTKSEN